METELSFWQALGIAAYYGIGIFIVVRLLKMAMAFELALPIGFMIITSIAYFLFFRGTSNRWTRDKRPWTLVPYLIVHLLGAVGVFLIIHLFGY